jgi:hypothetical protein
MTPKEKIKELIINNGKIPMGRFGTLVISLDEVDSASEDICRYISEITGKDIESFLSEEEEIV